MKEFFCILLMVGLAQSKTCVQIKDQYRREAQGMTIHQAQRGVNDDQAAKCHSAQAGRKKRDSGYGLQYQPTPVKVVVMPPPGQVPADAPQPGQPGGGARPETNPYIAAMAPEGTVPVAVYPPFDNYNSMKYPTECVLFSELEDFEDAYINDDGNVQLTSDQYEPTYSAPGIGSYSYQVSTNLTRSKRQINFGAFFRPRSTRKAQDPSSSLPSSTPSFGQPAYSQPSYSQLSYSQPSYSQPSYSPPSYVPPTEPPVKVVYRKFGFVCLVTVATNYCVIDDKPGYQQTGQFGTSGKPRQYGQAEDEEKKCPNNYGYGGFNSVDTFQKRYTSTVCSPVTSSFATPCQPGQTCGPQLFA